MRIVITAFLADGTCELSGKNSRKPTECLKVLLDTSCPPITVSTTEFIKLVRFRAQQEAKRTAQLPQEGSRPNETDR